MHTPRYIASYAPEYTCIFPCSQLHMHAHTCTHMHGTQLHTDFVFEFMACINVVLYSFLYGHTGDIKLGLCKQVQRQVICHLR